MKIYRISKFEMGIGGVDSGINTGIQPVQPVDVNERTMDVENLEPTDRAKEYVSLDDWKRNLSPSVKKDLPSEVSKIKNQFAQEAQFLKDPKMGLYFQRLLDGLSPASPPKLLGTLRSILNRIQDIKTRDLKKQMESKDENI